MGTCYLSLLFFKVSKKIIIYGGLIMKKYAKAILQKSSTALELLISGILGISIIYFTVGLAGSVLHLPTFQTYASFNDVLGAAFSLVIGIELIRMLCSHSPATVFEVLVFAVARQIVMYHSSAMDNLIGAFAIAILFAIRKYLFCEFDESEKVIFRGTQKVSYVNRLIHVHIPYENNEDTLCDVVTRKLEADNDEIGIGACTYYKDFGLRIAEITNGKITRIEVIRSIH